MLSPVFSLRAVALSALFAALGACASLGLSPAEATRAAVVADSLGHTREAFALFRSAARRGDLDAQMALAQNRGTARRSLSDWLFEPRPSPAEARRWAAAARTTAARLAAAGHAEGHRALGQFAWFGPDLLAYTTDRPLDAPAARQHFEAARAAGSARAAQDLAHLVWQTDGLLASESAFRASLAAGNADAVGMLHVIALNRPALEHGLRPRDTAGRLALVDIVGGTRALREAGGAEGMRRADEQLRALRTQAQAGDAEADSLLQVLAEADLLG